MGLSAAEILAEPDRIWNMAGAEDGTTLRDAFSLSDRNAGALDVKVHITSADGHRKHLHVFAALQHQLRGSVNRTVLVLDITEQSRIEDELHKSREIILHTQKIDAIGSLTGGMAHDFNNLLAVILGNLELLQEDPDPAHVDDYVKEAIAAALRGRDLTRNLLSFARKAPLQPVTMDLNGVVRGIDNMIRRTVPENNDIEISLSGELSKIKADRKHY